MKVNAQGFRASRMALVVAAAGLLPLAAAAQGTSMSDMQARYKADMQRCSTLTDPDSKRTCQREAGAALQEARRDRLVNNGNHQANAAARCARLPSAQRADCERLMTDSSAVEHGSVSGGGVLRELTITVPADQVGSGSYSGQTGTTTPQSYTQPGSNYGAQPAPTPAPAPGYGAQPAPAPQYGTQPAPGSYSQPAPAPAPYGTMPAR